ncbi:MAG: SdiA-regulated domain-containing protein [Synechococcus sp.]
MSEAKLSLSLISKHRIVDRALGLNEPSGLTLNHDGTALYTVSDDTKAIFRLDLKGRVTIGASFFIGDEDLEGLAISGDGQRLHAVQEDTNSVISFDIATRTEVNRQPLVEMLNFTSIAKHFPEQPDNKGLEGITVNTRTGHVVVVKESRPGLLIEIDLAQGRILNARLMTEINGFSHPSFASDKLDFSGLSYDNSRDTFWITSDKGQCLFHYDWNLNRVIQRLDLSRKVNKPSSKVRKSEGVAIDPARQRLYVVSERDGDLFTYQIHPNE